MPEDGAMPCLRRLMLGLLVVAVAGSGSAAGLKGLRPLDRPWLEDPSFRIDWHESWQATRDANLARWKQEMRSLTKDRRRQGELLALRRIRLLEALSKRFPGDAERHARLAGRVGGGPGDRAGDCNRE